MLIVVSPAKRLDENPASDAATSLPEFQDLADQLAGIARQLQAHDLEKLMRISPKLGALNAARFRDFSGDNGMKPCIEMFAGDTYAGLEGASLDPDEMRYAQQHLRILSGLYGLLRPMDRIKPHRLEMGTRLANPRGATLYEFWGKNIAQALTRQAEKVGAKVLLNCASVEYFKAVDVSALPLKVVTPVFLEMRPTGPRVVSFYAKKARGAMARFVVQNRLRDPEGLRDFDTGGYRFQPDESSVARPVFLRRCERGIDGS